MDSLLAQLDSVNAGSFALRAMRAGLERSPAAVTEIVSAIKSETLPLIALTTQMMARSTENLKSARRLAELLTQPTRPREWQALGHIFLAHFLIHTVQRFFTPL